MKLTCVVCITYVFWAKRCLYKLPYTYSAHKVCYFTSVCRLLLFRQFLNTVGIHTLDNLKLIFVNIPIFNFCLCCPLHTYWKNITSCAWPVPVGLIDSLVFELNFLVILYCFQHCNSEPYRRKSTDLCYLFLPPLNPVRVLSLTILTYHQALIYTYVRMKRFIEFVCFIFVGQATKLTYFRKKNLSCAYFSVVAWKVPFSIRLRFYTFAVPWRSIK